ncbi:MAG: recombinase family protein [Tatlockia sp.]|nr:recombinase family protein [Tatlockia sp.]
MNQDLLNRFILPNIRLQCGFCLLKNQSIQTLVIINYVIFSLVTLNKDFPKLNELLSLLKTGDTLIIWKLDRMGRSLQHLITTFNELIQKGIGVIKFMTSFSLLNRKLDPH